MCAVFSNWFTLQLQELLWQPSQRYLERGWTSKAEMNQWASKLTSEILDDSPMLSKGGICGDLKVRVQPLIAVYSEQCLLIVRLAYAECCTLSPAALVTKPRMLSSMDERLPLADCTCHCLLVDPFDA